MVEIHSSCGVIIVRPIIIPNCLRVRIPGCVRYRSLRHSGTIVGQCRQVNCRRGPGEQIFFILKGHCPTAAVRMHEKDNTLRTIGSDIKIAHMVSLPKANHHGHLHKHIYDKFSHLFSIGLKVTDCSHKLLGTFFDRP